MGFLRLLLAACVAQQHLGVVPFTGSIAVFGFFILSGFLVTMTINEVYNNGLRGKALFLLNRFLRIYPVYWACLWLGILFLRHAPHEAQYLATNAVIPQWGWWRQIWIFGLLHANGTRHFPMVITPAWSLNIELVYYLVIGLVAGKSRTLCWLWLAVSAALFKYQLLTYHSMINIVPVFELLYYNYAAGSIAFAVGSLTYHYRNTIPVWRAGGIPALLLLACVIVLFLSHIPWPTTLAIWGTYHFLTMAAFAYIVPACYRLGRECLKRDPAHPVRLLLYYVDRWCGRVSYPFFLLHAPAGAMMLKAEHRMNHSMMLFIHTSIFTLFLSTVVICVVELPIESIRRNIRQRASVHAR